jgi:hypothetical protein
MTLAVRHAAVRHVVLLGVPLLLVLYDGRYRRYGRVTWGMRLSMGATACRCGTGVVRVRQLDGDVGHRRRMVLVLSLFLWR